MWQEIIVWGVVAVAFMVAARYIYKRLTKPHHNCEDCSNEECKMRGEECDPEEL